MQNFFSYIYHNDDYHLVCVNDSYLDSDYNTGAFYKHGHLTNNVFEFNSGQTTYCFDLKHLILLAVQGGHEKTFDALRDAEIDIYSINPRLLYDVVDANQHHLLKNLSTRASNKINQDLVNYAASVGNLQSVIILVDVSQSQDDSNIILGACAMAIQNNHVNIVRHYFTADCFISAYDIMFEFFLRAVKYGHKSIIRFFLESGIQVAQQNYRVVRQVSESELSESVIKDIIELFREFDANVDV